MQPVRRAILLLSPQYQYKGLEKSGSIQCARSLRCDQPVFGYIHSVSFSSTSSSRYVTNCIQQYDDSAFIRHNFFQSNNLHSALPSEISAFIRQQVGFIISLYLAATCSNISLYLVQIRSNISLYSAELLSNEPPTISDSSILWLLSNSTTCSSAIDIVYLTRTVI